MNNDTYFIASGSNLLRVFAGPSKHVKGRSKRGWTEPTPAQLARAAAAKAEAEADRKAAKDAARQLNEARHAEWLKRNPSVA